MDITAQCLRCLIHSDTESCIKALLDTSVSHGPHFDWVVAHVGSCFPNTVITRVLSCGLKDFCAMGYERNVKSPRLNSVVGILGHLASSHFRDIERALLDLFEWSLAEDATVDEDTRKQKLATVPFLLNLASLSQTLLRAMTSDVPRTLRPCVVPRLASFATDWCKYFGDRPEALLDMTVHLALGCERGATRLIALLLDMSLNTSDVGCRGVESVCREILELILQEIDLLLRSHGPRSTGIALLDSVKREMPLMVPMLLDPEPLRVRTAVRLLRFLKSQSPNAVVTVASYVLVKAPTTFHLAALMRLVADNVVTPTTNTNTTKTGTESNLTSRDYFTRVLEQALRDVRYKSAADNLEARRLFQNLTVLLRWEKASKAAILRSRMIVRALRSNLREISSLLMTTDDFELANDIVLLLDLFSSPENDHIFNVQLTLKLSRAVIRYFFCLCIPETDVARKERGVRMVCHLLRDLTCYSPCARVLALREILESAIDNEQAKHFGAKEKFEAHLEEMPLLRQNHKQVRSRLVCAIFRLARREIFPAIDNFVLISQVTSTMLAQRHSSVFHAGVIGHGPRRPPPENSIDKETVALNKTLLIDVVKVNIAA